MHGIIVLLGSIYPLPGRLKDTGLGGSVQDGLIKGNKHGNCVDVGADHQSTELTDILYGYNVNDLAR
jgi:hypothetical protein